MVAHSSRARRQLELFHPAARTPIEAEQQARTLKTLYAMCSNDWTTCSKWWHASDVADRTGISVPETRAALFCLLYCRAVRRREGKQADEWTTAPHHLDACQECGACYPGGRQVERPNDEPRARPEDLCSRP